MKYTVLILFAIAAFVLPAFAGNDYLWGTIGDNDYKLAKDTVKKAFFVGLKVKKTYTFKQSDNLNALTITAIKVTDKKKSHGATAVLKSGGPGSKGATIAFTSDKNYGISDVVEIWGR
ncbi:uncharacterized protein [Drosophila takahashii]|uniref:uncharacterized protein n=1 Tax=Drosophila takahashii TaxID=29030 RepID=UPI0007E86B12|nr:uncharacterized protein LOC108068098 [Drosophila takahashii]